VIGPVPRIQIDDLDTNAHERVSPFMPCTDALNYRAPVLSWTAAAESI